MVYRPERRIDLLGSRRVLPSGLPPNKVGEYLFSGTDRLIEPVPEQTTKAPETTERQREQRGVHPVLVLMPDGREVKGTIKGSTLNTARVAALSGDLLDKDGGLHSMPSIELEVKGLEPEQPDKQTSVHLRGIIGGEALPIDTKTPGIPSNPVPYKLLDRDTHSPISAFTGAPGHIGSLTIH